MAVGAGASQRQQQSAGMIPEHLMGKNMLKMSFHELQQFVVEQIAVNPALVLEEDARCPICGCALVGSFCPMCGSESTVGEEQLDGDGDDWQEGLWTSPGQADDEYYEPFARVAAPKSLAEHLKEQIRVSLQDDVLTIAEFLIDCLDDDGYLREPLLDIANRFRLSVPQLENVLFLIQRLDPAGVGARDLRECLHIQIAQLDDDSEVHDLAERIISDHWEGIERMKLDRVASALEVETSDVMEALAYIRENLNPTPASGFRDPWQKLAPRGESRHMPDVRIRTTENGLVAEILDPATGRVAVDEAYSDLYAEMMKRRNGHLESDRAHIRECVQTARALIEALEFRKGTLQSLAQELIETQSEFIVNGPSYLKPLTRKELAARVGVHESTICRATSEKSVQLPSGEVVPFDVFFDSALPVKELVRRFATEQFGGRFLSDSEIAEKLKECGVSIARRTVAKYRDQLHLLPVEYRLAQ